MLFNYSNFNLLFSKFGPRNFPIKFFFLLFFFYLIYLELNLSNSIEIIFSFICFSINNKKYSPSDEDIEYAEQFTDLSFWDEEEKDLEFFIKRDNFYNDGELGVDNLEYLTPEVLVKLKDYEKILSITAIKEFIDRIKNSPKNSFIKNDNLKDNWEELIKEGKPIFKEGKSPYDDFLKSKTNSLKNKTTNKTKPLKNKKTNKTTPNKRSYSTSSIIENKPVNIDKKSSFFTYSPIFNRIQEIYLNKKLSNFDKQNEVENLINEKWLEYYFEKNKSFESDVHSHLFLTMKEFIIKLEKYFNTKKKYHSIKPLVELKIKDIAFVVFNELKPILNLGVELSDVTVSGDIGKALYMRWLKNEFLLEKKNNSDLTFHDFKQRYFFTNEDYHNLGDLLKHILLEDSKIFSRRVDKTDPKNTKVFIMTSPLVQDMFSKNMDVVGFKLPMLVPPVKWSKNIYGGYLRNNEIAFDDLITSSTKSKINSIISNNLIYDSVNYISSIPYKINIEVLNFIKENGESLGLLNSLHEDTKNIELYNSILNNFIKKSESKIDKRVAKNNLKEILSFNSNFYLQKNIIGLATLYSLVENFYFTVKLDWRGRLYSESTYLNFQGNELSKALILFKNGKEINTSGLYYLKIYGANLFGKNKLSFEDRVKWLNENHQNILDMKLDFINKADKKLLFIAFCFEYKKYISNPNNFVTHLPVLFDASCNGMQHLAGMVGDSIIAKNVNLLENSPNLEPYDFYSFCLKLLKEKLDTIDPNDIRYVRIRHLEINRSVVKTTIMTIPYNVTIFKMAKQLSLFFKEVVVNNEKLLKPDWYEPKTEIYISHAELYYLSKLIHETLYEAHPKLANLVKYFSDMATLLSQLNLPIIWNTPPGLAVKQKYVKFDKHEIKSSLYYKSSTYTITIPTNDISTRNQRAAFMPNLIHSMDASNIYLLIDKIKKEDLDMNLFTVHDCFASTAESMPLLNTLVRSSFIELYSDNQYLSKMSKFYREYIIESGFKIENNLVITNNGELAFPEPPVSENLNLSNMLDKAIYLIH